MAPPAPAAPAAVVDTSVAGQLERLTNLLISGALTAEEFAAVKARLLS